MASSMGGYTLKVTPEILQAKSGEISSLINQNQRVFDAILTKINSTANYWQGEASENFRKNYMSKKSDIEIMFKRLSEHVTDLNSIAAEYTGVEKMNVEIADSLPFDVIV